MPQLLYTQGKSLHYPLKRRLTVSQSQSTLCRHEESPTCGQNQTLIPQAFIPYPGHHADQAILATERHYFSHLNSTRCQSKVYYINLRHYLFTLRLCQKNIWTSQIQRTDRSVLWLVSLLQAAIKSTVRFKCIHRNCITPTDRHSFPRCDSCSTTQEIPCELALVPILSYFYPIQSLAIYYHRIYLHIILPSMSISPGSSLTIRFSDNIAWICHLCHMHYMFYPYHTLIWSLYR